MSNIQYEILDPRPSEAASVLEKVQKWKKQGKKVIGFEVTVAQQADLLDQNIDPQHLGGNLLQSCILDCFKNPLPRANELYVFCTNRADLDSVGAMALISHILWRRAYDPEDLRNLVRDRVHLVHEADIFARGEWSPRPLLTQGYEQPELGAIARAVSDFKVSLEQRVQWMADWLMGGSADLQYEEQYQKEKIDITDSLNKGESKVFRLNGIACVESTLRSALAMGYAHAPIVVAFNPKMPSKNGFYKKHTVSQYCKGYVDLQKALKELNALEPGWGGSPTIIGSPQEQDSILSDRQVYHIIHDCRLVDERIGLFNLKDAHEWAISSEQTKALYTAYQEEEWKECEWYSMCTGNSPYHWGPHVGESFSTWLEKEKTNESHISLWHNNPVFTKKSATV